MLWCWLLWHITREFFVLTHKCWLKIHSDGCWSRWQLVLRLDTSFLLGFHQSEDHPNIISYFQKQLIMSMILAVIDQNTTCFETENKWFNKYNQTLNKWSYIVMSWSQSSVGDDKIFRIRQSRKMKWFEQQVNGIKSSVVWCYRVHLCTIFIYRYLQNEFYEHKRIENHPQETFQMMNRRRWWRRIRKR